MLHVQPILDPCITHGKLHSSTHGFPMSVWVSWWGMGYGGPSWAPLGDAAQSPKRHGSDIGPVKGSMGPNPPCRPHGPHGRGLVVGLRRALMGHHWASWGCMGLAWARMGKIPFLRVKAWAVLGWDSLNFHKRDSHTGVDAMFRHGLV